MKHLVNALAVGLVVCTFGVTEVRAQPVDEGIRTAVLKAKIPESSATGCIKGLFRVSWNEVIGSNQRSFNVENVKCIRTQDDDIVFLKTANGGGHIICLEHTMGFQWEPMQPGKPTDEAVQRWKSSTWRITLNLDAPNLVPPVVQFAIFDEDPVPGFRARLKKMQTYLQEQLLRTENKAKKELARSSLMSVNWDLGFKRVTGDKLYLLKSAPFTSMTSNSPAGKKWIVTKTVRIKGKPVCWCMTAEVKMGEQTEVIFTEDNVFGLEDVLDTVMRDPDC
jgi:hypothetical protein